jgi:hypothetical protein
MSTFEPSTSKPVGLERLKQLILYVAEQGQDDPALGAIKLNKILYFSDVRAYLQLGKPITGATYQHLPEGPAPRELLPARRELLNEDKLQLVSTWYFNRRQERVVAKSPPNLTMFSEAELRIVREVMEYLADYNASEVTDLSHREWGWQLTRDYEEIPYRMAWLSSEPLTEEQIEYGKRLWAEIGGLA